MNLKILLKNVNYELLSGKEDINVAKVCYDSRTVEKNSLFVAIKGIKVDGHKFISSAIESGATVIIVEEIPNEIWDSVTMIKIENTRLALSSIACNYYDNPSEKLKVIGITGTNGKTSTSLMLKNILVANGKKVGVIGTIGSFIGEVMKQTKHTTPESLELQELLADMVDDGIEYVIMEVSSHALQLARVSNIKFQYAIFTNLTQDHLDFHGDMNSYFHEKKKLFTMNQGTSIVNTDDAYGKELQAQLKSENRNSITCGLYGNQEVHAKNIEYSIAGVEFTLCTPKFEEKVNCPIPGKFTVYNLLSSITVALAEEMHIGTIKKVLKDMPTVPGRIERVMVNTPYEIIIDFAHTPDALRNVLITLKQHVVGRLITLFGCGGDRDISKRPLMGKIAGEFSDFCIVTTDNPRSENPQKIIDDVLVGVKETNCEYSAIVDRQEAIIYALKMAKENDVILLAGKGHETYQVLHDKTIIFDEKIIIKEYLNI